MSMSESSETVTIEITLSKDNMERLKKSAQKYNLSYSEVIEDALDVFDIENEDDIRALLIKLQSQIKNLKS